MIREGGVYTAPAGGATTELLDDTQFSTITEARQFTVRAVANDLATSYELRIGTLSLSKGTLSNLANGIGAADDPVIYSGVIPPGNVKLSVTVAATKKVHWDITAF